MNDKPQHIGHRKRLRDRFLKAGGEALHDYEMLELVLFLAQTRGDTKPLAKRLIDRFGSYAGVLSADAKELTEVKGVGEAAVAALKTVRDAAVRLAREEITGAPVLSSWQSLLDYCRATMGHAKNEQFRLFYLNKKNTVIADELQQVGTVDHTAVYPREVVKRALDLGATAIIMVHNHPSGDTKPSRGDIEMTQAVKEVSEKLGIQLHDHVIVGKSGASSFKSMGLL
ncbi:MAG: DNA repair protein RadC [Rhodospirillales bacterium]|nr:DNA repair protein RadC [Rhodospirillales bacterium]